MKRTAGKRRSFNIKTSTICGMGILTSLAIVLACFARGIWPGAGFLEYTPADVPVLMGTFMYGPLAGIVMAALVAVIQGVTVSASSGIIGIVMNFISIGVFVLVAGIIYRFKHTLRGAVISLLTGALCGVVIMVLWNMLLTPLYMKVERSVVLAMIPSIILPFNLVRYISNAAITFILYKSTHKLLNFAFKKMPDIKFNKKISGEYVCPNVEKTYALAEKIADTLTGGETIVLQGDLGAGKTTFTKGLAIALGVKEEVTSPTFTIMNVYEGDRFTLNHLDMYRIGEEEDLSELGVEESFSEDAVTVIEWNKFKNLTGRVINVKIETVGENERKISVTDGADVKKHENNARKVSVNEKCDEGVL